MDYTETFHNALENWKIEDWSKNDKNKRIKSEKQIQKRLKNLKKVCAFSIEEKSIENLASFTLYLKIGLPESKYRKQSLENTALFVEYHTDENSEAYTTLMWFDKKKNYIKLRRITGHPLKVKEIHNNILVVYKFREEINSFEEFFIDPDTKLSDLLDGNEILIFVDAKSHTVWHWIGDFVNTRMKFISAKMAPTLGDVHWINYKIRTIYQGNEPIEFLNFLGIEKEKNSIQNKKSAIYEKEPEELEIDKSILKELTFFKNILKIEYLMKENSTEKLIIARKYLPEIFDAELLEISKLDGLPTLKPFVSEFFESKGISTNLYGNEIFFFENRVFSQPDLRLNPHQILKFQQAFTKRALVKESKERKKIQINLQITLLKYQINKKLEISTKITRDELWNLIKKYERIKELTKTYNLKDDTLNKQLEELKKNWINCKPRVI